MPPEKNKFRNKLTLANTLIKNKQLIKVSPSINRFLMEYMGKFQLIDVDGHLIMHSHLPPINSKAFTRFIDEQLLDSTNNLSHAQISLTNLCNQHCDYCYNKGRTGERLTTARIKELVQELKKAGVFWLGLTGGEPLLNNDLVDIIKSVGDDCAIKLFTTGETLTENLARELKDAGLVYVSISLDHWEESEHDRIRGKIGAFGTALQAIDIFKKVGIHVSVSSVVSKSMLSNHHVEKLIDFLISRGVHEAWLSEAKPAVSGLWHADSIITESEQQQLIHLQDAYNKGNKITVNYLGHFECGEHFGCNAGNKMVYIDAFGEVSPCVFVPMTFGNVTEKSLDAVYSEMRTYFPCESHCFINENCELLKKHYKGESPICKEDSITIMKSVAFSPQPKFGALLYKRNPKEM